MKEMKPRLKKVIDLQKMAIIGNTVAAFCITYFTSTAVTKDALLLFVISIVMMPIIMMVLNTISLMVIQLLVYGGDNLAELAAEAKEYTDAAEAPVSKAQIINAKVLSQPDKTVGRYMDTNFYEWFIADDGVNGHRKFFFVGTVPVKYENSQMVLAGQIPVGALVIPPGLVYQAEEQ